MLRMWVACLFFLEYLKLCVNSVHSTVPTGPFLRYHDLGGKPYTITADERSWIINGQRTLLLGGSVHYPRLSPGQWTDIFTKMLNDGLNNVEVYIFWNLHEPIYDFSGKHIYNYNGRANLTGFIETAAKIGLFVNLRIGPYVCAEWSFGGLPTWLLHVEGIEFRANNNEWESYMATFVQEIANITQPYLARNGGPIIMAQIENEYHGSLDYVNWCGNLVNNLALNISWIMCNGMSASDTINTCNGNNCYASYAAAHSTYFPGQPLGWTENEGWFQTWHSSYNPTQTGQSNRSPMDMANSVATWFGAGGAHHNYYMYYGGNHISSFAGSGITNYYADGVNFHSDGLPHEPKKSHLSKLHSILAENQMILLEDKIQIGHEIHVNVSGLDPIKRGVFAYQYQSTSNLKKLTFLYNTQPSDYTAIWENQKYFLAAYSVAILDNNNIELYNTFTVNATNIKTERIYKVLISGKDLTFSSFTEIFPLNNNPQKRDDIPVLNETPLEQIRFTNNTFEYLIYSTNFTLQQSNNLIQIQIDGRKANAYLVYIDGTYRGQSWNGEHGAGNKPYQIDISNGLLNGNHTLTIISSSLGIDNGIQNQQPSSNQDKKGIVGHVNVNHGYITDITKNNWNHWIGLTGERLGVATPDGMNSVSWQNPPHLNSALIWIKTSFMTPDNINNNDSVILLDIGDNTGDNNYGMKRGHFWLNGIDMGHYNNVVINKLMVQRYYFIPNDYLMHNGMNNTLVFAEEIGTIQPSNINIVNSFFVVPNINN